MVSSGNLWLQADGEYHGTGTPLCVPEEKGDRRNRPPLSLHSKLHTGAGTSGRIHTGKNRDKVLSSTTVRSVQLMLHCA